MTINQIKEKLKSKDYDFLRTDKNLGNNIILLTIGGTICLQDKTLWRTDSCRRAGGNAYGEV